MKLTLIFLLTCLLLFESLGQEASIDLSRKIEIPPEGATSKSIIENLIRDRGLMITYQSNDPVLDYVVELPKKDSITIQELFNVLQQNLPYEFIYKDEYIILRKKSMPQKYELKGVVKSESNPESPVFAVVLVRGKSIGQSTDLEGGYSLKLSPGNYIIEYNSIGYNAVYHKINLYSDKEINVTLQEKYYDIDQAEIHETRERKMEVFETGRNIEHIDAKTIEQVNYNNPADVLHGRVNGVWATRVSGAPGDHQKVRIRGINSLFAAVEPLYVVNGVQVPVVNLNSLGIADINSNDIESITVLKDVASTAYYGYQGGNGVIKIETKKGGGENKIRFSTNGGIQMMRKSYPLMNSYDFTTTMLSIDSVFPMHYNNYPRYYSYVLGGFHARDTIYRNVYPYPNDTMPMVSDDWQKELFQVGFLQEYQLAFQGKKKHLNYYLSGNYYDHKGIVTGSNYKKYSYSVSLGAKPVKNLFVDFSSFGSIQNNKNNLDNYLGNKMILQSINIEPTYNGLTSFEKSTVRRYPTNPGGTKNIYNMTRTREMYAFISDKMPALYINKLPNGRDFFSLREQTLDINSTNYSLGFRYYIIPDLSIGNRTAFTLKDNSYGSLIRIDTSYNNIKYYRSVEKYKIFNNVFDIN